MKTCRCCGIALHSLAYRCFYSVLPRRYRPPEGFEIRVVLGKGLEGKEVQEQYMNAIHVESTGDVSQARLWRQVAMTFEDIAHLRSHTACCGEMGQPQIAVVAMHGDRQGQQTMVCTCTKSNASCFRK
jgi:hypothetical protein